MAEVIDWVAALSILGVTELVRSDVLRTLGSVLKSTDDVVAVTAVIDELLPPLSAPRLSALPTSAPPTSALPASGDEHRPALRG
jgi:hypothetical protein